MNPGVAQEESRAAFPPGFVCRDIVARAYATFVRSAEACAATCCERTRRQLSMCRYFQDESRPPLATVGALVLTGASQSVRW
jgi:hypothetical protein